MFVEFLERNLVRAVEEEIFYGPRSCIREAQIKLAKEIRSQLAEASDCTVTLKCPKVLIPVDEAKEFMADLVVVLVFTAFRWGLKPVFVQGVPKSMSSFEVRLEEM